MGCRALSTELTTVDLTVDPKAIYILTICWSLKLAYSYPLTYCTVISMRCPLLGQHHPTCPLLGLAISSAATWHVPNAHDAPMTPMTIRRNLPSSNCQMTVQYNHRRRKLFLSKGVNFLPDQWRSYGGRQPPHESSSPPVAPTGDLGPKKNHSTEQ